jgi:hypothetical protein
MELTWTKAVAIRTPVPKCLQKKKTFGGIFIHLTFFATTGNPQPPIEAKKTMKTAATCRGKSYSAPSASLPHTGFSMLDMMK